MSDSGGTIARRRSLGRAMQRFVRAAFMVAIGIFIVAFIAGIFFGGIYLIIYIARAAWENGR